MKYIFGHRPSPDRTEFSSNDRALNYLRNTLPNEQSFRYRTTYTQEADSIIFSFGGELLAELVVQATEKPSDQDIQEYGKARKVYRISKIRIFRDRTLRAGNFGLKHSQHGTQVPENIYAQIVARAGIERIIPPE